MKKAILVTTIPAPYREKVYQEVSIYLKEEF